MNQAFKIALIVIGIVLLLALVLLLVRGQEDTWIKDARGVWIKHGQPSTIIEEAKVQQELIDKINALYKQAKDSGRDLSQGPCLGTVDGYAVDIAHNPRTEADNDPKNQCASYISGEVQHFVELDPDGNILRIV